MIDQAASLRERALLIADLDFRNGLITREQVISQARQYEAAKLFRLLSILESPTNR